MVVVCIGSNVTKWDVHVSIGIEMGKREDVVIGEGLLRWVHDDG